MIDLKIKTLALCLSIITSSCTFISNALRTGYTEEQCRQIVANFDNLKIGMTKKGLFPEQKIEWEIWLLCADSASCIFQPSLGRIQCYKWHMVAFDVKTGKLIKLFSDDLERIGFA